MTQTEQLLALAAVAINGSNVPPDFMRAMKRLEVDCNLYLPDMCVIELHDPKIRWLDELNVGDDLKVSFKASGVPGFEDVFIGQIASLEGSFAENGVVSAIIRCYDRSHLLHIGTKVAVYQNVKDSDIASAIAGERGLQAQVTATTEVHEHVFRDNLSDYEFLAQRARANGFIFSVDDRKLLFRKPDDMAYPVVPLEHGVTLMEFRPVLSVAAQIGSLDVKGWDSKTKRPIVAKASSTNFQPAKIGWGTRGHSLLTSKFSQTTKALIADVPVTTQSAADALAKGTLSTIWSSDVKGQGVAFGNPLIRPGCRVNLTKLGNRFSGEYFVTSARHEILDGYYSTEFGIRGLTADTTADLIAGGTAPARGGNSRITTGLVTAIVTDIADPQNLGRVKLKYPWLDDGLESFWARLAAPGAGKETGVMFTPEVNDEVLVGFEHGSLDHPYILGGLWNGKDAPPFSPVGKGAVDIRSLKTRSGHQVTFHDKGGSEKIEIIDKTGNNKIVIDSASNKVTIDADMDIIVNAKGSVSVTAQQKVDVSGMDISVEGKGKVELKAPQITVGDGSGIVTIKGTMVGIN